MKYNFKSQQDKKHYARQMAEYISRNKFKAAKTNKNLYSSILKSLKDSKGVQLQGITGFQYTPVEKKASLGDSIKEGWKAFKDYSRENQWVQPTLQGATGAGIGALTGLLMGPKRRALKVLLSTLGGAGIGVGTGFATNYALKPKVQSIEQIRKKFKDDALASQLSHQMNVAGRPSDVALSLGIYGTQQQLDKISNNIIKRKPYDNKRGVDIDNQLTTLYDKRHENDIGYNISHPDMPQDKVWKAKKNLIRNIDDAKYKQRIQNIIRHIKAGTDYLLNRQYKR